MIVSFTWQDQFKFHINDFRLLACVGLEHVLFFFLLLFFSFLIWSATTFLLFFVNGHFNFLLFFQLFLKVSLL
jgi:hypothetical protein